MLVLAFVASMWFHDNSKFIELADRESCNWENEGWYEVEGNPENHLLINDQFAIWKQYCNE
jgi:hypothetical protein